MGTVSQKIDKMALFNGKGLVIYGNINPALNNKHILLRNTVVGFRV